MAFSNTTTRIRPNPYNSLWRIKKFWPKFSFIFMPCRFLINISNYFKNDTLVPFRKVSAGKGSLRFYASAENLLQIDGCGHALQAGAELQSHPSGIAFVQLKFQHPVANHKVDGRTMCRSSFSFGNDKAVGLSGLFDQYFRVVSNVDGRRHKDNLASLYLFNIAVLPDHNVLKTEFFAGRLVSDPVGHLPVAYHADHKIVLQRLVRPTNIAYKIQGKNRLEFRFLCNHGGHGQHQQQE